MNFGVKTSTISSSQIEDVSVMPPVWSLDVDDNVLLVSSVYNKRSRIIINETSWHIRLLQILNKYISSTISL